ncbi:MAG: hypothetical protein AAF830_11510 [Pseudomonadota bacterium]
MLAAAALLLKSAFAVLPEAAQAELTRCGVNEAELDRLLALDQRAFDQDFQGGWRAITKEESCGKAAAEVIKAYLAYSTPTPPNSIGILRWHAGQALASDGFEQEALPFFRASFHNNASQGEELDAWDHYVIATIAFIEKDRERLVAARDAIATFVPSEETKAARRRFLEDNPEITMAEGFVDQPMNLNVVEGLLACFGKPYGDAYGGECE